MGYMKTPKIANEMTWMTKRPAEMMLHVAKEGSSSGHTHTHKNEKGSEKNGQVTFFFHIFQRTGMVSQPVTKERMTLIMTTITVFVIFPLNILARM